MRGYTGSGSYGNPDLLKDKAAPSITDEEPELCAVCGVTTELDSDLVLCCDGQNNTKKCTNEVHMWCLDPPLSKVSPQNWYCPSCSSQDPNDKVSSFAAYMSEFESEFATMSFKGPTEYLRWLLLRQQQSIPLRDYYPGVLDNGLLPDSFRSDADEMI